MSARSWRDILDPCEEILWQDRPGTRLVFRPANVITSLFGIAFASFALFWMIAASSAGGYFWTFGLIHFFIGLGIAFGGIYWSKVKRQYTWYTLTDRRAIVATDLPVIGKRLKSYPITDETVLEYDGGDPATIYFASELRHGRNRTYVVKFGFERIRDGAEVYRMLRDIQNGAVAS